MPCGCHGLEIDFCGIMTSEVIFMHKKSTGIACWMVGGEKAKLEIEHDCKSCDVKMVKQNDSILIVYTPVHCTVICWRRQLSHIQTSGCLLKYWFSTDGADVIATVVCYLSGPHHALLLFFFFIISRVDCHNERKDADGDALRPCIKGIHNDLAPLDSTLTICLNWHSTRLPDDTPHPLTPRIPLLQAVTFEVGVEEWTAGRVADFLALQVWYWSITIGTISFYTCSI